MELSSHGVVRTIEKSGCLQTMVFFSRESPPLPSQSMRARLPPSFSTSTFFFSWSPHGMTATCKVYDLMLQWCLKQRNDKFKMRSLAAIKSDEIDVLLKRSRAPA
ncbi:unnamed protein product [Urochloa humidicola]